MGNEGLKAENVRKSSLTPKVFKGFHMTGQLDGLAWNQQCGEEEDHGTKR